MAQATSDYYAEAETVSSLVLTNPNSVVLDTDSLLNTRKPVALQEVKSTSLHLISGQALKNSFEPFNGNGVLIDDDSDIVYYPPSKAQTLTVIDTLLEDWVILRDAVKEGEILILNGSTDPLDAILAKLEEVGEIECLNILSHGESGRLRFNNSTMDSAELEANSAKWAAISNHLSHEGDIQLFGCNIAKGDEGKAFIEKLASITGADVAASINPTGAEAMGGDWTLEAVVGNVAGNLPFTEQAIGKFMRLLLPSGSVLYNLNSFINRGNYLYDANDYFKVSGFVNGVTAVLSKTIFGAFVNDISPQFSIRVEPHAGDLDTFELQDICFYTYGYNTNIQIYGYLPTGEKISSGNRSFGSFQNVTLNNFPNKNDITKKDLDYFIIKGSGVHAWDLYFVSFTVKNMKEPNSAPTITSGDTATFAENGEDTVYFATGTDPDAGDVLTWSISGPDAALFDMDSSTGVLTFKSAPKHNAPADSDHDNVYQLAITATDAGGLEAQVSLAVTVTAVSVDNNNNDNGNGNHNNGGNNGDSNGNNNGSSNDSSNSNNNDDGSNPPAELPNIEVNGQKQDAGSATTETINGDTVTTIQVDDEKLNAILENSGNNPTVTLPAVQDTNVLVGQLSGQAIKNMEAKDAILEIKTETITYTLPASQINIDDIAAQIGSQVELKDIQVQVRIAEPPADTVQIIQDAANENNYQIIVRPVEFEITCTSGDKTVAVSKFNGYVERFVAIPEGVDPSKITTGVVLNDDGTLSHVPTQIVEIDGRHYAKISSMTNSTYSVIWNPVEFEDVVNFWAEAAINDMGSRLIVKGDGEGKYSPNKTTTRAEFAAIAVRALGLTRGTAESGFRDVWRADWFNGYVVTASEYGLVNGYDAQTFGPYDLITREQAMVIISRMMEHAGLSGEAIFVSDHEIVELLSQYADGAAVSDYAKTSVAKCIKAGIVKGTSAGTISPKAHVTRAEVAVMIQRLLQKSGLI